MFARRRWITLACIKVQPKFSAHIVLSDSAIVADNRCNVSANKKIQNKLNAVPVRISCIPELCHRYQ